MLIFCIAILVGARVKRVVVYKEREKEVVASVVPVVCGKDSEQEVVAFVFTHCILRT